MGLFRRVSRDGLLAILFCCSMVAPLGAQVVPVDPNLDWAKFPNPNNRARTLLIAVEAVDFVYTIPKSGGMTDVIPAANRFPVFPNAPKSAVNPSGYTEPNPQAGLGGLYFTMANGTYPVGNPGPGAFTIGNAVRRAVASWNIANTGWKLIENETPSTFRPMIIVRMSRPSYVDARGNTVPEEIPDPFGGGAPPSIPVPIDGTKDQGDPDPAGGKGNGKVLAFFQCIAPAGAAGQKNCTYGQIVFNRNAGIGWAFGIDQNMNAGLGDIDDTFDPIILALHEIGHALRLNHENTNNGIGRGNADGNVMRAFLGTGVHKTNSNFNAANSGTTFDRNPSNAANGDIDAAKNSAQNPLP
jgi:hypothetical protein